MPNIHVILVCYRSEKWLERLLSSVCPQIRGGAGRLWIVDNDAMDEAFIENCLSWENVSYFRCQRNENYGGGNNIGFKLALEDPECEYVLVANPDTWYEPDAVRKLYDAGKANPDYGVLSGLQLEYETNNWSTWAAAHVDNEKANLGCDPVELPWIEGSCMFISRECLHSLGGFDPIYEMYYEDNDFCRRASLAGFKVGVAAAAKYHHYANASFEQNRNPQRIRRIDLSQAIFQITDPRRSWRLNQVTFVRWLVIRTVRWCFGKNSGFGLALLNVLKAIPLRYSELYENWGRRRAGDLHVDVGKACGLLHVGQDVGSEVR